MDNAVIAYKKRRQARLDSKNGVTRTVDSVEEYRKRRAIRMDIRGEFNENDHPREKNGQFAPKNSGGGGGKQDVSVKKEGAAKPSKSGNTKSKPENNRLNKECDGAEYKGKPGIVRSGKGGKLAPKSDISRRIDTSDAIAETQKWKETNGEKGLEKNSLSEHLDKDGNLSPERQKVHDEIIQKFFKDKVPYDGTPTMIMSGGGPASGKSFVSDNAKNNFGDETVVIVDPDEFKKMLPGFGDMAVAGDKAAGYYHEESSALAKRAYQYAAENGLNVVYDGTGDGSVGSVMKKLKTAQDAGYKVKGEYVTVDVDGDAGALVRNRGRYEHSMEDWNEGKAVDPPRLVRDDYVRDIHAKVSNIAPDVANLFDEWTLTDNNVPRGAPRPLIARCKKGGEIEVVKGMEDKVQAWLDKGTRGGKVVNGKVVFPDEKKKRA